MDAILIDFTSSHYELTPALDLKPGNRVRLPQTVIDGQALAWQIGAVTVERVEEKVAGVVFIWLAPESIRPGGDRFLMLCGQYLAAGVARIVSIAHTATEETVKGAKELDIEPRGTVYGTRTHRQWSRVIDGTVFRFELIGPSAYWKSGPTVRVTRHPYGRYQDVSVVHERMELTPYVDGMEDTHPCVGDRGHFLGRCVECDAARMAKATPDDVESWYLSGRINQAKYEAYMYAWATSTVRHAMGGWAEEPTDPEVAAIVAAIRRHAGITASAELAA